MSYAIHNQNPAFNDSAIAQYMNTDFIVLDISLCVALAREQFFEKLKDDDIPSHIFLEDNGRLAGMVAVRKLLQTADTSPGCWPTARRMSCRWSRTVKWSAA